MGFLSIVQRELRLQSRKWKTYWIRVGAALLVTLLTAAFMLVAYAAQSLGGGAGSTKVGHALFLTLAWLAFIFCLVEGARSSADCLSEEKREGTLGLLFLTDLRGYDIVIGKFVAASLNSFYGLLAIFPILGVALLIGGVAPAQFWRMMLVLANTMFLATSAGLFISALCRHQARAWGATLGLIFGVTVIPILISLLMPKASLLTKLATLRPLGNFLLQPSLQAFAQSLGRVSPMSSFLEALASGYGRMPANFWWTLFAGHLAAWLMLALASLCLPYTWQEGGRAAANRSRWFRPLALSPASQRRRTERRTRILDLDPVMWLATRDQTHRRLPWYWVVFAILGATLIALPGYPMTYNFIGLWFLPFRLVFKIWVALRVCRFFVEARTSGALELFLTTPLSENQLIRGQFIALKDYFLVPLIAFLVAEFGFSIVTILAIPDRTGALVVGGFTLLMKTWDLALLVGWLFAIAYTGMWLSIVLKKPGQSFGLTILLTIIFPLLPLCIPKTAICLFFILFPKHKLESEFRRRIAGDLEPRRVTVVPASSASKPPPLPISPRQS